MHRGAVFLGGMVAGVTLSAACGLDLFREDRSRQTGAVAERLGVELARTREFLARSEDLLREANWKAGVAAKQLALKETELSALSGRAQDASRLEAEASRSRSEAGASRAIQARLQGEVEALRRDLQAASREIDEWRRFVHDQALAFFSRERDPGDAQLLSRYLRSDASKESQQEVLLALIAHNKPLLLHLIRGERNGGLGAAGAGLENTSAGAEPSGPQPAARGPERP